GNRSASSNSSASGARGRVSRDSATSSVRSSGRRAERIFRAPMTPASASPIPIVALDVPSLSAAKDLVRKLGPASDFYKVGVELYTKEGPAVVEWLKGEGKRVFLDLKLHDIPNTVKGAAASAASLGVELLTVHALGGEQMVKAAVEGANGRTDVIG